MNWPEIAAAAEHAGHAGHNMADMTAAPTTLTTLSPAEAAEVDAIANRIVPGGATPGAQDARVIYFIDNALGSFFAAQLPSFRKGLADFAGAYATRYGADKPFSAAPEAQQTAWLKEVEKTPFFTAVRRTHRARAHRPAQIWRQPRQPRLEAAWRGGQPLLGPPFGYYDKGYPGFEPYPGTKPYTA